MDLGSPFPTLMILHLYAGKRAVALRPAAILARPRAWRTSPPPIRPRADYNSQHAPRPEGACAEPRPLTSASAAAGAVWGAAIFSSPPSAERLRRNAGRPGPGGVQNTAEPYAGHGEHLGAAQPGHLHSDRVQLCHRRARYLRARYRRARAHRAERGPSAPIGRATTRCGDGGISTGWRQGHGHRDTRTRPPGQTRGHKGGGSGAGGTRCTQGWWHRQWDRRTELSTHRAVRCLTVPLLLQSGSSASKPRTSPITTTRSFAVCPT